MSGETILAITPFGFSPYSARGLQQTLQHIGQAAALRRTVNGDLVDISSEQFRKYQTTITGNDQEPPAFDSVWPGQQITVDCISEMSFATGGAPGRAVVPGSLRVDGDYTFYRPRLTMRVVSFNVQRDEWQAQTGWTLTAEES